MSTFGVGIGHRKGGYGRHCDTAADALRRLPQPRSATPEVWAAGTQTLRASQSSSKQTRSMPQGFPADEPEAEVTQEPHVEEGPDDKLEDFEAEATLCKELRELLQTEEAELQEKRFTVQAAQRSLQNFLEIAKADKQELALLREEWADEQQQIAEWMQTMDEREKDLLEAEEKYQCQEEEVRQADGSCEQEMLHSPAQNIGSDKVASQTPSSELRTQLRAMEEQQALLMQRIGSLRKETKRYSEDRDKLSGRIDSVKLERRSLQAGIKAARHSYCESESRLQEINEVADADAPRIGKLELQVVQLRAEVEELSLKNSTAAQEPVDAVCRQLQEKVVQLRKDLGSRRAEVSLLNEELAKQRRNLPSS